jgi:septum formation protein
MNDLLKHLSTFQIYLASRSPRRQSLLSELGIPFKTWLLDEIDELFPDDLEINQVAVYLAGKKANPYRNLLSEGQILICADTIVCCEGRILGKPNDEADAYRMLSLLSGKQHLVITGVKLLSTEKETSFSSETKVFFSNLSSDEIHYYIDVYKPFDKAGSYGIQEWIGLAGISSIEGSYFNVMGLPIQRLYQELKKFTNYTKKI